MPYSAPLLTVLVPVANLNNSIFCGNTDHRILPKHDTAVLRFSQLTRYQNQYALNRSKISFSKSTETTRRSIVTQTGISAQTSSILLGELSAVLASLLGDLPQQIYGCLADVGFVGQIFGTS